MAVKVLLLLLLALPVQAAHHRSHALGFLLESMEFHAESQHRFAIYLSRQQCTGTPAQCAKVIEFTAIIGLNLDLIDAKQAELHTALEAGDLETLRALVNQPQQAGQSILQHMFRINYPAAVLLFSGATPITPLQRLLISNTVAWRNMDRVIWHINDAIREEIYVDPAFQ